MLLAPAKLSFWFFHITLRCLIYLKYSTSLFVYVLVVIVLRH